MGFPSFTINQKAYFVYAEMYGTYEHQVVTILVIDGFYRRRRVQMNDINYRKIVKFSPAVILLSENLQLFVPYRAFVLRYIKLCKYTLYQAQRFHLSYEYFLNYLIHTAPEPYT